MFFYGAFLGFSAGVPAFPDLPGKLGDGLRRAPHFAGSPGEDILEPPGGVRGGGSFPGKPHEPTVKTKLCTTTPGYVAGPFFGVVYTARRPKDVAAVWEGLNYFFVVGVPAFRFPWEARGWPPHLSTSVFLM